MLRVMLRVRVLRVCDVEGVETSSGDVTWVTWVWKMVGVEDGRWGRWMGKMVWKMGCWCGRWGVGVEDKK